MAKSIGRNQPCPCGSGEKYKKCCKGKVPWEELADSGSPKAFEYLTNRGKNRAFLAAVSDALQLDTSGPVPWDEIKKACTPGAVRQIHESIPLIWPSADDLSRVFEMHGRRFNSLYIGMYEPEFIFRGVTRHAIYSDHILLFDPFHDHRRIAPKYNPVEHPEEHIFQTLKNLHIWTTFAPWIEAGLVSFIRSPANYDYELFLTSHNLQDAMLRDNPELQAALDRAPSEPPDLMKSLRETLLLLMSKELLEQHYREMRPEATATEVESFIGHVRELRDAHPYIIGIEDEWKAKARSELMVTSSGENFHTARLTANLCSATLITDIPFRWKQIELDRQSCRAATGPWEPISKAFGGIQMEILNNVPLPAALTLHQEGKLSSMRVFLRKLFRECSADDEFDEANISLLADELAHEIEIAREEWRDIDRDLKKWLARTATGGISAGIVLTNPIWVGIGTAMAAITEIGIAWDKKRRFSHKLPAAFFLGLESEVYQGDIVGI